jgi:ribosomal protein S12 methylthiotransferase
VAGAVANELPDPVPEEVKEERLARLMALQEHISATQLERRVGQRVKVLVDSIVEDEEGNRVALARSSAEAPDIDGVIQIDEPGMLKAGDFASVELTDSDDHDLWAVVT